MIIPLLITDHSPMLHVTPARTSTEMAMMDSCSLNASQVAASCTTSPAATDRSADLPEA